MSDGINQQPEQVEQESTHTTSAQTLNEDNFINNLSEDLRGDPSLKDFKDLNGLAKSYINAQKMLGNSIRIPSEDAGEEALNDFYSKLSSVKGVMKAPNSDDDKESLYNYLGKPESIEGYEIKVDESIPVDHSQLGEFKELAYDLNLTKEQAQKSLDYYHNIRMKEIESHNQISNQNETELQQMWGNEFKNNVESANAVALTYKDSMPEAYADLQKIQNNPIVLDIMANYGRQLHEQGHKGITNTVQKFGMTSSEALERIKDIQGNPAYFNGAEGDPNRLALQDKLNELYPLAYPDND